MRGRLTIALAAVAAGLVACAPTGSTRSTAGDPAPTPTKATGAVHVVLPTDGTVSGVLRMYGGPMNPTTGKAALNGEPQPHSHVTIVSTTGQKTETTSDSSGRFTFRLHPGVYQLACTGAHDLVVQPDTTIQADCQLDVP